MKRPSLMAKPSASDERCVGREHLAVDEHQVGGLGGGMGCERKGERGDRQDKNAVG